MIRWSMTLKDLAWIGLGILVSWDILMHSYKIFQITIRSQMNTIENADEERREDADT